MPDESIDKNHPQRDVSEDVDISVTSRRNHGDVTKAAKSRSGPSRLSAYVAAAVRRQIERDAVLLGPDDRDRAGSMLGECRQVLRVTGEDEGQRLEAKAATTVANEP